MSNKDTVRMILMHESLNALSDPFFISEWQSAATGIEAERMCVRRISSVVFGFEAGEVAGMGKALHGKVEECFFAFHGRVPNRPRG